MVTTTDPEDTLTLQLIRQEIAQLPEIDRERVDAAASQIRTIVQSFGGCGLAALALVGAEVQVMAI